MSFSLQAVNPDGGEREAYLSLPLGRTALGARTDLSVARDYHAQLCGWPYESVPTGNSLYQAVDVGAPGVGGGIVQCGTPPALWLLYVEVDRVDEKTERPRNLGAGVLLPPREGPAGCRIRRALPVRRRAGVLAAEAVRRP